MTEEQAAGNDEPIAGCIMPPEDEPRRLINMAIADGESFRRDQVVWLRRIYGVRQDDSGPVSDEEVRQLSHKDIDAIVESLSVLRQAAGIKGRLRETQRRRLGLYLAGFSDRRTANEAGIRDASTIRREREEFINFINGSPQSPLAKEQQLAVDKARRAVMASLIGPEVVGRTVRRTAKHQPNIKRQLAIFPARETLEDLTEGYYKERILPPESVVFDKQLLVRHFLDTEQALSPHVRNWLRRALDELHTRLQAKIRSDKAAGRPITARPRLNESVNLLRKLTDNAGGAIAQSRATYVAEKYSRLDAEQRQLANQADDKLLDIALSWLYEDTLNKPSEQTEAETAAEEGLST